MRRQERRRRRERHDGENVARKWAEEEGPANKERERPLDKKRTDNASESDRMEKTPKQDKKDDSAKRERLRNKVMRQSFYQNTVHVYLSVMYPSFHLIHTICMFF